jgi:EAL and modified HD-GYP domain-containing signal transduction protein
VERPAPPAPDSDRVFIARQPILDRTRRVVAYELLFRTAMTAVKAGDASSQASARVMSDAVVAFGLDRLTQGRRAFINVTRDLLLAGIPAALPPRQVVLELLETIEADDDVLAACRELRRAGYAIALDDFVLTDATAPLIPLANYIKVDAMQAADRPVRQAIVDQARRHGLSLLAEKVETARQFADANGDGFDFFQGYFFGRPVTESARDVPSHQLGLLRLLQALQDPDLTVHKLDCLVQHDASLCFRVLQTVNSAGYGQRAKISSIQQALVLLGIDVVRRWASLWVLAGLNAHAHPEVMTMASIRARACELLARRIDGADAGPTGFLLGMCSMLDAILDQPMELLLDRLPLPADVIASLRGDDTPGRRLLDCAVAYERGDWDRCDELAAKTPITPDDVRVAHADAMKWADEFQRTPVT